MKALISVFTLVMTMAAFSTEAQANRSCTALMQNHRGMTVDTFNAWGYTRGEACQQAKRQCERAIWNGHRQPGARLKCVIPGQHGGGYGQVVTRHCSTSLIGPRGRTIQYFQAHARGQARTGVKRQACRKALRQCNRYKNEYGYYRARCMNNEINPPVNPPRARAPRGAGFPRDGRV